MFEKKQQIQYFDDDMRTEIGYRYTPWYNPRYTAKFKEVLRARIAFEITPQGQKHPNVMQDILKNIDYWKIYHEVLNGKK